jgi:tRNA-specific 2-thiouridylase
MERYENVRAAWIDTGGSGTPEDASRVARFLGVPFEVVDGREDFRSEVVSWSERMLKKGMTPNPCARCNARVKLLSLFRLLGSSEDLVTGHYAGKRHGVLCRGKDPEKDQSYFLSMVAADVLSRCVFPLGDLFKSRVRERARSQGLPFRSAESMDLCFETVSRGQPGSILDVDGNELGEHEGIEKYTIGQRRGLGAWGRRMYVVALDPVRGTVTIGERSRLLSGGCTVTGMNWLMEPEDFPFRALAQTRYRKKPVSAVIDSGTGGLRVRFDSRQEAVAPGQVCALYLESSVMGGGLITKAG